MHASECIDQLPVGLELKTVTMEESLMLHTLKERAQTWWDNAAGCVAGYVQVPVWHILHASTGISSARMSKTFLVHSSGVKRQDKQQQLQVASSTSVVPLFKFKFKMSAPGVLRAGAVHT